MVDGPYKVYYHWNMWRVQWKVLVGCHVMMGRIPTRKAYFSCSNLCCTEYKNHLYHGLEVYRVNPSPGKRITPWAELVCKGGGIPSQDARIRRVTPHCLWIWILKGLLWCWSMLSTSCGQYGSCWQIVIRPYGFHNWKTAHGCLCFRLWVKRNNYE